jgi:hypothetical protein
MKIVSFPLALKSSSPCMLGIEEFLMSKAAVRGFIFPSTMGERGLILILLQEITS